MHHLSCKVVLVLAALAIVIMRTAAQAPAQKPSFEPVAVKTAAYGQSVQNLITYAYSVHDFQIVGGPDWVATDRWDIQPKAGDDIAPLMKQSGTFSLFVQSILETHFHLRIPLTMALEEEPGLRLQSVKGPVEVLVIDSVQKPSGN